MPEPKQVKNRVHVDVYGDVDALVAHGARIIERRERWTVMADPEGNEFCAFGRGATDEASYRTPLVEWHSPEVVET